MTHRWTFFVLSVSFLAACAHSGPAKVTPIPGEDQAAHGARLYANHCAKCHGASGEGIEKKGPPVVGEGALPKDPRPHSKRKVTFQTALDVASFVKKAMPGDDPGSLTDEEYFAILAFDLKANGVDVSGKTIDASTAGDIVLR